MSKIESNKTRAKEQQIKRKRGTAQSECICGHAYNENYFHECQFPKFQSVSWFQRCEIELHSGRAGERKAIETEKTHVVSLPHMIM